MDHCDRDLFSALDFHRSTPLVRLCSLRRNISHGVWTARDDFCFLFGSLRRHEAETVQARDKSSSDYLYADHGSFFGFVCFRTRGGELK